MACPSLREPDARGEAELLAQLRQGNEVAFRRLVERHNAAMWRVARAFVTSRASADEVVQETWLAVIRGLDRFEARSSLKTWIFSILINRARSIGERERRMTPFSSLAGEELDEGPTVDPDRFLAADHPVAGYWARIPTHFFELPEEHLLGEETRAVVLAAIGRLPPRQQQVISLRDVEGWDGGEVCDVLGLSAANQRVLLHRARAAVRAELERYFDSEVVTA